MCNAAERTVDRLDDSYLRPHFLRGHFSPRQARIDRMKLHFPQIELCFDDAENAATYFQQLANHSLLTSSHDNNLYFKLDRGKRYHFGGKLSFRNEGNGSYIGNLTLDLNPTRFMAHNGVNAREYMSKSFEELYRKSSRQRRRLANIALDSNDNFLVDNLYTPSSQNAFLLYRLYIERLLIELFEIICSAGPLTGNAGTYRFVNTDETTIGHCQFHIERAELRGVEAYWDTRTPNAVDAVRNHISPAIRQGGYSVVEHTYPLDDQSNDETESDVDDEEEELVPRISDALEGNNCSVILRYGDKPRRRVVELSAYAKSHNVVRFEYRYFRSIASYVNRTHYEQSEEWEAGGDDIDEDWDNHPRPALSMNHITTLIDRAIHDAHLRLGRVMETLGEWERPATPNYSNSKELLSTLHRAHDLLRHVRQACVQNEEQVQLILSMLRNNSGQPPFYGPVLG